MQSTVCTYNWRYTNLTYGGKQPNIILEQDWKNGYENTCRNCRYGALNLEPENTLAKVSDYSYRYPFGAFVRVPFGVSVRRNFSEAVKFGLQLITYCNLIGTSHDLYKPIKFLGYRWKEIPDVGESTSKQMVIISPL